MSLASYMKHNRWQRIAAQLLSVPASCMAFSKHVPRPPLPTEMSIVRCMAHSLEGLFCEDWLPEWAYTWAVNQHQDGNQQDACL